MLLDFFFFMSDPHNYQPKKSFVERQTNKNIFVEYKGVIDHELFHF